jgi:hypothetical protein
MIVKIHSRGKGRGKGPVDYLLGKNRDREDARLDQGNPAEIIDLIDSLKFKQKYTSGVLSFAEKDLPDAKKRDIMRGFEATLFPGLDKDQYSILWVQHLDKDRLELNFVIPNVELTTGKRLQPYFDRADRVRVNAFKVACNAKYELADPDDPLRRRFLTTANDAPKKINDIKQSITDSLLLMLGDTVNNRQDVERELEAAGYVIDRTTTAETQAKQISIKNPNGKQNARNIQLKGALYEESFSYGPSFGREIEEAGKRYKERARERLSEAIATYKRATEIKREYHHKRFKRPKADDIAVQQVNRAVANGDALGRRPDAVDSVLKPEPLGNRKSRAGELGEVPRIQPKSDTLQDQVVGDDRARERAIAGCRGISEGAAERTAANESAGDRDQTVARIYAASTQIDRIIGSVNDAAGRAARAIRAASGAFARVIERHLANDDPEPDRGPRM